MLSFALSTGTNLATSFFHLPFDEEEDNDIENYERKYITWDPDAASSSNASAQPKATPSPSVSNPPDDSLIQDILRDNDLYSILGLSNKGLHDKLTLRRAYLARSRLCHPDKFPSNPDATQAFQKVSVAYNVLSTPDLKRRYDEHIAHVQRSGSASSSSSSAPGSTAEYDVFASARPSGYAEDTLRSVILGVFNDFLDNGDLEVVRNLLKAINEMNPGVKIGEDGVKTVLSTLHSIRERALTCRTCIYTLHNEVTRLLEVQHAFSQLSYFDILGRTRMAVQISRIAVGLPVVLEKALVGEREEKARLSGARAAYGVFPRHVMLIVKGVDVALERMERILKR
ncbi:hypothetical protein DFP72DRAFT_960765 [Ephemerocybe angulata]|uniref:J domain-containing protein n=1 Tax=Ephemerocybe angulata TaxID=980116 RepID=A0A8H6I6U8_9AGAR|nr:hypothetical protein DFP72DRAFT_960765 [Tulosesus angulatus]